MANPVGSIQHVRFLLSSISDRADKYSFGMTIECVDDLDALQTPTGADMTSMATVFEAFLNTTATGAAQPIANYISRSASRGAGASELVTFDISNALGLAEPAGAPYSVTPFTLGPADAGQGLPEQVCQTVAWRADYGSDAEFGTSTRPRADDRNRMFLGPLAAVAVTPDTETPTRIEFAPSFLTTVSKAFAALVDGLNVNGTGDASHRWHLVVWSRKLAITKETVEFSQNLYPTTQRRRVDKRPLLTWTLIGAL